MLQFEPNMEAFLQLFTQRQDGSEAFQPAGLPTVELFFQTAGGPVQVVAETQMTQPDPANAEYFFRWVTPVQKGTYMARYRYVVEGVEYWTYDDVIVITAANVEIIDGIGV